MNANRCYEPECSERFVRKCLRKENRL